MSKTKLNSLQTFPRGLFAVSKTHLRRTINSLKAFWHHHNKTMLLILLVATTTTLTTAAISMWLSQNHNLHLPSIGTIHTIGVKAYWDSALQNETTEIQWGTIYPGSLKNVTLYIQSTSNVQTILEHEEGNWTFNSTNRIVSGPSDTTQYMNLTWDYDNTPINPHETMQVTLTLNVDNSSTFVQFLINEDVNQFSFDILISADEG